MSSPGQLENVNRFKGNSGAECEDFIQSIRETAWKEGKLQNALWMANFAFIHFSEKALEWHSDLSPDVKQDWDRLEKALLERWPPPADESDNEQAEAAVIPTPAPASLPTSDICVMQFVSMSGDQESIYISEPYAGQCKVTTEIGKALRLRWDRSVGSESRVLEWVGSRSKWLAIHWSLEKPSFEQGSTMWARMTVVDPDTLTPATSGTNLFPRTLGPFRIKVWKVSPEGQITPVWKDGVNEIQLGVFVTRGSMFFAVDPDEYQKAHPNDRRGRLVFRLIE